MAHAQLPASTSVSRVIATTPSALWPLISAPQRIVDYSDELDQVDVATASLAVGDTFLGHNRRGQAAWTTTCTVSEATGTVFEWTVEEPDPLSRWRFEIVDNGDGTCTLTQSVTLYDRPSGLTAAIDADPERESEIVSYRLRVFEESMTRTLEAFAADVAP